MMQGTERYAYKSNIYGTKSGMLTNWSRTGASAKRLTGEAGSDDNING